MQRFFIVEVSGVPINRHPRIPHTIQKRFTRGKNSASVLLLHRIPRRRRKVCTRQKFRISFAFPMPPYKRSPQIFGGFFYAIALSNFIRILFEIKSIHHNIQEHPSQYYCSGAGAGAGIAPRGSRFILSGNARRGRCCISRSPPL